MVLVHGMPGVGKSAFAQEGAHRVASNYPHGQLYANLGSGGSDRPAGDVLKEFLIALGWPEKEIPGDTETRGKIYRSLTRHRRILVVLDAARDYSQVRELLPNGRRQAVIVTSRRDLGPELGATILTLDLPSTGDALEILRATTRMQGAVRDLAPIYATTIVRRCGRLPRAIHAAGVRIVDEDAPQGDDPMMGDILEYLNYDGVNLNADFEAEYQRLLPREQLALRILTLVQSPTFVPWALCPLLDVDLPEAENLVTRLGAVHLLEVTARSITTGTARYRFHPLVREFAVAKCKLDDESQAIAQARTRLDAAYLGVVRAVLFRRGELTSSATPHETSWLPPESVLERIAMNPSSWVRTEHANLVRCISTAKECLDLGTCWRIAPWLGECVPLGVDPAAIEAAFKVSQEAVRLDNGTTRGRVSVQLAEAGLLVATNRHPEAEKAIAAAVMTAESEGLPDLAAVGHRRHAEAFLQIGAYESAIGPLLSARRFADLDHEASRVGHKDNSGEQMLIALLEHECSGYQEPRYWQNSPPNNALPDWHGTARFRAHLAQAETDWRRGNWPAANLELEQALDANRDDASRVAAVEYSQARLCVAQAGAASAEGHRVESALRGVERAAEALVTFRDMRDDIGELRSRSLLTRALVLAGQPNDAARQGERALSDLEYVASHKDGVTAELVRAAVHRANGEARLRGNQTRLAEAIKLFTDAGSTFREHGDWWTASDCDIGLGRAHRSLAVAIAGPGRTGHLRASMAALWRAAASFYEAGDVMSQRITLLELIATASDMGHRATVRDLRKEYRRVIPQSAM